MDLPNADVLRRVLAEMAQRAAPELRRYLEVAKRVLRDRGTSGGQEAARVATRLMKAASASHAVDPEGARHKAWEAARLWQAHGLELSPAAPAIERRVADLLRLAANSSPPSEEAKNAAIEAARRLHRHHIVLKAPPAPKVPPRRR